MVKDIQAKHVDENRVVGAIYRIQAMTAAPWVHFCELQAVLPDVPPKVLRAKLSAMIKKRIIDGCTCGCRGDFTVVPQ